MFRFVALFALVAVAAAEPEPQFWANQYGYGLHNAAHLKTPSGDTVSVEAAKVQHHQLKAAEYAKKAYIPYAGVVASPVANAVYNVPRIVPATYAAAAPVYTNGVYNTYGLHHLGKREAEADSQVYYGNTYAAHPFVNNMYNTGVYGGYTGYTGLTGYTSPLTTYGYGMHHLGKREAESDSQYYTNTYGFNPYYTRNVYNANVYGRFPYGTTYGNVLNRFHY